MTRHCTLPSACRSTTSGEQQIMWQQRCVSTVVVSWNHSCLAAAAFRSLFRSLYSATDCNQSCSSQSN